MITKLPLEERVRLVIDAWSQQFDNPPFWQPEVRVEDDMLLLDGKPICKASTITTVSSDPLFLAFYGKDARYIVEIEWPSEGEPFLGECWRSEYPSVPAV